MIGLIQNETLYEYDIRSLILAFCIGEKIELSSEGDDNSIYAGSSAMRRKHFWN